MPKVERPRERLIEKGAEALKDAELLAILLRMGYKGKNALEVARRLLSEFSLKGLMEISLDRLGKLKGIGPATACSLKASFELSKRALNVDEEIYPLIRTPKDVADEVANIRRNKKENFIVLYLNARNQVIDKETISIGTLNANIVHPREVFKPALANSAANIVLVHNHPSGDPSPSQDDLQLTNRIVKAGELMGIEVLDHVIVTEKDYCSLKDKGMV